MHGSCGYRRSTHVGAAPLSKFVIFLELGCGEETTFFCMPAAEH